MFIYNVFVCISLLNYVCYIGYLNQCVLLFKVTQNTTTSYSQFQFILIKVEHVVQTL